jgi:transcriptional regulator with XRE-family HTH domain
VARTTFDPKRSLGLRIKELRAALELTQEDLADRCGIFRTYMSRIEAGRANPTLTMLYVLSEGLGVGIHALFEEPRIHPVKRVRSATPISRGRVTK